MGRLFCGGESLHLFFFLIFLEFFRRLAISYQTILERPPLTKKHVYTVYTLAHTLTQTGDITSKG